MFPLKLSIMKLIYISLVNYHHYPQQTHGMNRKFSLLFLNCICRLCKPAGSMWLSGDPPKRMSSELNGFEIL